MAGRVVGPCADPGGAVGPGRAPSKLRARLRCGRHLPGIGVRSRSRCLFVEVGLEAPARAATPRDVVIGASALVHAYSSRKILCRCFFLLTGAAGDGYLGIGQAARGLPSHQKEPPFQTRPDIASLDRTPGVAPAMDNSEATAWLQEPPPLPCPSGWCCRLQWDRSSPITTAALGPSSYSRMGFCWSILSLRALLGPGLLRCTGNPLLSRGRLSSRGTPRTSRSTSTTSPRDRAVTPDVAVVGLWPL